MNSLLVFFISLAFVFSSCAVIAIIKQKNINKTQTVKNVIESKEHVMQADVYQNNYCVYTKTGEVNELF